MSNQSTTQSSHPSGFSLRMKLVALLLFTVGLPAVILGASLLTNSFSQLAIMSSIAIEVVGLIVGFMVVMGVSRQSQVLSRTLSKINSGDFEARAETLTTDELGAAAVALNAMCDNTLNLHQSNDDRNQIQNSIERLIGEMENIAAGDLTIKAKVSDDVTGSIASSVNNMTHQLNSIVQRVQSAAQQVTTSSSTIREASTMMSMESDQQAGRIQDASDQLVDVTEAFQEMAMLTESSVQVAVEGRQIAEDGLKAVSDTIDGMQRIRNQVQGTSKRIKSLGESSQEIGEIVQMISDIADRTSILALNASIQASMAGDAGKGFAVVAEEIERLAERSTNATKQISQLIRSVQNETGEVISDMEESTQEVVAGSKLATQAGETLVEIDRVSSQLVTQIQKSATFALEQADTASKVANSMSEICTTTKASAEKSRVATNAVGRMAEMVSHLSNSMSQFKVAGSNLQSNVPPTSGIFDSSFEVARTESVAPKKTAPTPTNPTPATGELREEMIRKLQNKSRVETKSRTVPVTMVSSTQAKEPAVQNSTKAPGANGRQPVAATMVTNGTSGVDSEAQRTVTATRASNPEPAPVEKGRGESPGTMVTGNPGGQPVITQPTVPAAESSPQSAALKRENHTMYMGERTTPDEKKRLEEESKEIDEALVAQLNEVQAALKSVAPQSESSTEQQKSSVQQEEKRSAVRTPPEKIDANSFSQLRKNAAEKGEQEGRE